MGGRKISQRECNARARRCDGRDMRRGAKTRSESSSHFNLTRASKSRIFGGEGVAESITPFLSSYIKGAVEFVEESVVDF